MNAQIFFVAAIDEPSFLSTLKAVVPLAKAVKGHIMAAHVAERYPVGHVAEAYWHAETNKAYEASVKARQEALEAAFYGFCRDEGVPDVSPTAFSSRKGVTASWETITGDQHSIVPKLARRADAAVLAMSDDQPPHWMSVVAEDLLIQSGVPLFVVPKDTILAVPTSVVVAWNGGLEARRALALAEPFLLKAKSVRLVSVGIVQDGRPTAVELAESLSRKGLPATGEDLPDVKVSISDQIVLAAEDAKADLLVLGAYSHPRWREMVLGGVTRTMLLDPPMPVLLAH